MNLIKEHWTKQDVNEFENYLFSFSKGIEKGEWEKRIINTNLNCIAVPSHVVQNIVRDIHKGNFIEFINLWLWNNYTETAIIGKLICKIKDFNRLSNYIKKYASMVDNWASCDCLKFVIKEVEKEKYFNLATELIESEKPFVKRVGLNIIIEMLKYKEYLNRIFDILAKLKNEEHYYVNMMVAWIVAESFTKYRDETLKFFKENKLNKFTNNKAISKCHDSFRVSYEDKEMLKSLRI